MTPLAIVYSESPLLGGQLANQLHDLGYRVAPCERLDGLATQARTERPLILLAEIGQHQAEVLAAIEAIRTEPGTRHIPVIAITHDAETSPPPLEASGDSGTTLYAMESAVLSQLPRLLEHALAVE